MTTQKDTTSDSGIKGLNTLWDDICNLVIRPQRNIYDPETALGSKLFTLSNKIYQRTDLELENERKLKIKCSFFQPIESQRSAKRLPCVVYCHGNSGCRVDSLPAVQLLLPMNITVFAFDFTGSGLSDGKHVSLGFYEKEDVKVVISHLRKQEGVSRIGLYGRSMGAATTIMYAAIDPSICGVVCDSPFTSLEDIIVDLVQSYKSWIPKSAIKIASNAMRSTIQTKAQFDITKLRPIDSVRYCFVPALFGHGEGDNFIRVKHSQKLHDEWSGDKNIITFDGDHNSQRPDFFFDSVGIFFYNVLVSNDTTIDTESNRPKTNVMMSRKIGIGQQTKRGKIIQETRDQQMNTEIEEDESDLKLNVRYDGDVEKEMEMIKTAMIESINESLTKTLDPKEIIELNKRLEEIRDKNFKFTL